jgi:hypothetical protein
VTAPTYAEVKAQLQQLSTDEAATALFWLLGYLGDDKRARAALAKAAGRQLDLRAVAS